MHELSSAIPFALRTLLLMLLASAPAAVYASASDDAFAAFAQRQAALLQLAAGGGAKALSTASAADAIFGNDFEAAPQDCSSDRDGDALPDCAETGTNTYNGIADAGTDPDNADSDGDGLSDGDEVFGTAGGLDLPALGVSPLRRDLLLEYDWFEDATGCARHSHAPAPAVLDRVARIFANAGVVNPDGSTGINIIQDHGQGGVFVGGNLVTGYAADLPGTFDSTWMEIREGNFAAERRGYFRYVLMPHRYNGTSSSSGYAEVVGDDAIVSMGCALQEEWIANTIVHEVGHLLGLHHGGFEACNGKPNYNSLMNYRYQFAGIDATCTASSSADADLSHGERLLIDENAVNEHQGVCGAPAIDWDADGTLTDALTLDLNPEHAASCGGQQLRTLRDFDDWNNLTFLGVLDARAKLGSLQSEASCAGAPLPGARQPR